MTPLEVAREHFEQRNGVQIMQAGNGGRASYLDLRLKAEPDAPEFTRPDAGVYKDTVRELLSSGVVVAGFHDQSPTDGADVRVWFDGLEIDDGGSLQLKNESQR